MSAPIQGPSKSKFCGRLSRVELAPQAAWAEFAANKKRGALRRLFSNSFELDYGCPAVVELADELPLSDVAILGAAAFVGVVAIAATIYVCYRFAEGTVGALGESGTNVVVRLSAFILFCLGTQILWSGASELLRSVLSTAPQ